MTEPLVLSPKETCSLLKIGRTTLWRMEKRGELQRCPWPGPTRYRMEDILALVGRTSGGPP
jgi:hypothetical protein